MFRFGLHMLCVCGVLWGGELHAQNRMAQQQQRQQQTAQQGRAQVQPANVVGTLEGAVGNGLQVRDEAQQAWQVFLPNDARLQVTGTASADCLQSRMFVDFTAEFDARGAAQEKVGELSIVSWSPQRPLGLHPAGDAAFGKPAEGSGTPAGTAEPAAGKRAATGAAGKGLAGRHHVVGQISSFRNNRLIVRVGRMSVNAELAEEPKITVDAADLAFASPGDKVTVKGVAMSNRPQLVRAQEVKIEMAQPLTGKKKSLARVDAKKNAKAAKKDAAGLPEKPADH